MEKSILSAQYEIIKGSREALLNYCATIKWKHLTQPVEAFNNSTIVYLLAHNANTYLYWLQFFESGQPTDYYEEKNIISFADIRAIFDKIDEVVSRFLADHYGNYFIEITKQLHSSPMQIIVTPLQLFTHATTHEFHHKGQILSMSRLFGYIPVGTDAIRF